MFYYILKIALLVKRMYKKNGFDHVTLINVKLKHVLNFMLKVIYKFKVLRKRKLVFLKTQDDTNSYLSERSDGKITYFYIFHLPGLKEQGIKINKLINILPISAIDAFFASCVK